MSGIERKTSKKKNRSWSFRLFMFGINLELAYLLFLTEWFYYAGLWMLGGSVILFLINNILSRRNKSALTSKESPIDFLRLIKKYLIIQRKYIIVSLIGLTLSTIMLSQTVLTASTYERASLDDFLGDEDNVALELRADLMLPSIADLEILDQIEQIATNGLEEEGFKVLSIKRNIYYNIRPISAVNVEPDATFLETVYSRVTIWNDNLVTTLNNLGYRNINTNQSIFLFSSQFQDRFQREEGLKVLLENQLNLSLASDWIDEFNGETILTHSIPVDNHIFLNEAQELRFDDTINNAWEYFDSLIMSEKNFYELIAAVRDKFGDDQELFDRYRWDHRVEFSSSIIVEIPDLTEIDIDYLIIVLENLEFRIRSEVYDNYDMENFNVYSPLKNTLWNYQWQSDGIRATIIIMAMPLLAVSLFLVYFSITLVEQRKSKLIAIMKIRGTSENQLKIMQYAELISIGLIASIVGMVLSIPWVTLSLKSSGFFQFDNPGFPLWVPATWFWRLPLMGIIITFDLNMSSVLSLSSTRIDEGEVTEEKREPFWQRLYLDLIIFSISALFWIFIRIYPISSTEIFFFLLYGLGPILLISLILSSPLVIARYFSGLIGFVSDLLWKVQGGMIALATRNMRKNKYSSSRLVALLMLGMMLSYLSMILPYSIEKSEIERSYYRTGSDIYVGNVDVTNITNLNRIQVEGVKAVSEISKATVFLGENNPSRYINTFEFLGINKSNFEKTAFWNDNYADNSLKEIISKITPGSVGTSNEQLAGLGLDIGDFITQDLGPEVENLKIDVTFDFFPNLISYIPVDYGYYYDIWSIQFLADYETTKMIGNFSTNLEIGAYLKLQKGANSTQVVELLIEEFENDQIFIENAKFDVFGSNDGVTELSIINSSFQSMLIITVLVSIIAVGYFSFITLAERKREIGTFRAIGMTRSQLFMLLVVEGLILLSSGVFFGAFMGWFVSSNFFFLISGPAVGGIVPPQYLYIPWRNIFLFLGIMFVSTSIATAYPADKMSKEQTGNILRAE